MAFTNVIQDVLFHFINHSTYHRGQIALQEGSWFGTYCYGLYIFYKNSLR